MSTLELHVDREAIREHDRALRRTWWPVALGGALVLPVALWLETKLDDVPALAVAFGVLVGEWASSIAVAVGLWMSLRATRRLAMPCEPMEVRLEDALVTVARAGQTIHTRARVVEAHASDTFLQLSVVSEANVPALFAIPLDRPQRDAAVAHLSTLVPVRFRRSLRAAMIGLVVFTTTRTLAEEWLTQVLTVALVVVFLGAPLLACGFGGASLGALVLVVISVVLALVVRRPS
jgi:hypothetical protein